MLEGDEVEQTREDSERVPASQRLGPIETSPANLMLGGATTQVKRGPGRPPGSKKTLENQIKPRGTVGSGSKSRKVAGAKPSPVRRVTKAARAKSGARPSRGKKQVGGSTTSSENRPICNMIPASSRRRMDFRIPSAPGP